MIITLLDRDVDLEFQDQVILENNLVQGYFDPDTMKIRISKNENRDIMMDTLLHELTHAFTYILDIDGVEYYNERTVNLITLAIGSILKNIFLIDAIPKRLIKEYK